MISNPDNRSRDNEHASASPAGAKPVRRIAEEVAEEMEAEKHRAEARMDSMAQSMYDAVDLFHDENEQLLARSMDYAAERLESMAKYLKDRSFRGLQDDAAEVARTHSLAFLGLALASGLAIGRFLRSTSQPHHDATKNTPGELPFSAYGHGTQGPQSNIRPSTVSSASIRAPFSSSTPQPDNPAFDHGAAT